MKPLGVLDTMLWMNKQFWLLVSRSGLWNVFIHSPVCPGIGIIWKYALSLYLLLRCGVELKSPFETEYIESDGELGSPEFSFGNL